MNMNRKSFLARLTALVAAPFVVTKVKAETTGASQLEQFNEGTRLMQGGSLRDNPYFIEYREELIRNINGEVVCVARYQVPRVIS
jgi:hypothetical protein